MAYWLLKTEPDEYSWDNQVKRGAKGEAWTGVRNFTARRHLKEMKKGDKFFFYHTGDEKQIVGIGEVIRESFPDRHCRKERALGGRHHHCRQATAETCDAREHKGRAEAQGYGARQIRTPVSATGNRRGVEARV